MNFITAILLLTSLLFTQKVFADCNAHNCINVKVSRLFVSINKTFVSTSGNEKLLSCTASEDIYLTIEPDAKNYNALYSLLLSSHISGATVDIRTTAAGNCEILYLVSNL